MSIQTSRRAATHTPSNSSLNTTRATIPRPRIIIMQWLDASHTPAECHCRRRWDLRWQISIYLCSLAPESQNERDRAAGKSRGFKRSLIKAGDFPGAESLFGKRIGNFQGFRRRLCCRFWRRATKVANFVRQLLQLLGNSSIEIRNDFFSARKLCEIVYFRVVLRFVCIEFA